MVVARTQIAALCAKKLGDKSNFCQSTDSVVQFYRDAYKQVFAKESDM